MGTARSGPRGSRHKLSRYSSGACIRHGFCQLGQLCVRLLLFFQSLLQRACNILQPQRFRERHERAVQRDFIMFHRVAIREIDVN